MAKGGSSSFALMVGSVAAFVGRVPKRGLIRGTRLFPCAQLIDRQIGRCVDSIGVLGDGNGAENGLPVGTEKLSVNGGSLYVAKHHFQGPVFPPLVGMTGLGVARHDIRTGQSSQITNEMQAVDGGGHITPVMQQVGAG